MRDAWRLLVHAVVAVWFREVEVVGRERFPEQGPTLVVASHFNGLLDPVLVADVAPRLPRFLGKSTLWRNPVLARVLDSTGALPVYRPSEGSTARNEEMFAACYQALVDGSIVALFPEGTTHDHPQIREVRTGAARIALGARAAGAKGLQIVPVGLLYSAKASPRSRALVRVAEPIDLDRDIDRLTAGNAQASPDDAAAVKRLTGDIQRRLADAALDYDDADVALVAARAAAVALRPIGASRDWEPSLDVHERCARAIADAPPQVQLPVVRAFARYHDALTLLGISDATLVAGDLTTKALRRRLGGLAGVAAATPAAALGFAINGPAIGLVWAAGRLQVSTPMRGTVRLLVGLAGLTSTWVGLRWALSRRGWREPTLAAAAAGPGCGLVALSMFERLRALRSARASAARLREHAAVVPMLWAQREALVASVADALDAAGERDVALPEDSAPAAHA